MGAITTHSDDTPGCGKPDILSKRRNFSAMRFAKLKVQGKSFVHVGAELAQGGMFSVTLTQGDFTRNLETASRLYRALGSPKQTAVGGRD